MPVVPSVTIWTEFRQRCSNFHVLSGPDLSIALATVPVRDGRPICKIILFIEANSTTGRPTLLVYEYDHSVIQDRHRKLRFGRDRSRSTGCVCCDRIRGH